MTPEWLITPEQHPFIKRMTLEEFWEERFDIFGFPGEATHRMASAQAELLRRYEITSGKLILTPYSMVNEAQHIEQLVVNCEDIDFSLRPALMDHIERRSGRAGHYFLALTGAFCGVIGANDQVGRWFLLTAADHANADRRQEYKSIADSFSDVRMYIEYTMRKAA